MHQPKTIKELLLGGGNRLEALSTECHARSVLLAHVCAVLPPKLAENVASVGLEHGKLSIGVAGAVWASRLRYSADMLRKRVGDRVGVAITSVRIRVVPPRQMDP